MIPEKDITYIQSNVQLDQLITADKKQKNGHWICCCPLPTHSEKTASFHIYPDGHYHCYGCGAHGGPIDYVMRTEGLSFVEAVRKLAASINYQLHETADREKTQVEIEEDKKRDEMREAYIKVQRFFVEQLYVDSEESVEALKYARRRWKKAFVEAYGIGYAPDSYNALKAFARKQYISEDTLIEMGLLKAGENGSTYDAFRCRLMIPIRNVSHMIIGYTARHIPECYALRKHKEKDEPAKYHNSKNSILYDKSSSIFGIDVALPQASKEDMFYLVEGAPDVLRLQYIGIKNAIAPLGSKWTDEQINQVARRVHRVCIIPDIDPVKGEEKWGTGILSAINTGARLIAKGFDQVLIKEIPQANPTKKIDADEYFTSTIKFNGVESVGFIVWYAQKLAEAYPNDIEENLEKIATLISHYQDDTKVGVLINAVRKHLKGHTMPNWHDAITKARKTRTEQNLRATSTKLDGDMLETYGFQESCNTYITVGASGKKQPWSNFVLHPLFHIKDPLNSSRIFEIINNKKQREIIELKADDLVSLSRFKLKVESLGNYLWEAKEEQLTRLKRYLYEATETATLVTQLGWQRQGFFAFGNGIFDGNDWIAADSNGIARMKKDADGNTENYYFPGASRIYKNDPMLYQFERRFVHREKAAQFSFEDYADRLIFSFGENGKVGIAFTLAAIFRDIIVRKTKMFPLLNIFGPKGSGKSELGHTLMAFFIRENTPPNLQTSTIAALADAVAQCSNALVHFDEYKNTLDISKVEFLKGIWDGAGRNRMNMDRDKKREVTQVDSAIILTGQEMPSADNALFSRLIYLTTTAAEVERSDEENQCFRELVDMRKQGCTHLTLEVLRYRAQMEAGFADSWDKAAVELRDKLDGRILETRIFNNWLVPLASFRTLQPLLQLPYTYEDLLDICARKSIEQNDEAKTNDEKFNFWELLNILRADGNIAEMSEYRLLHQSSIRLFKEEKPIEFGSKKRILAIRFSVIYSRCEQHVRRSGKSIIPQQSILHYLRHAKDCYIGLSAGTRFSYIIRGEKQLEEYETPQGTRTRWKSGTHQAHCFDYDVLVQKYGVNLIDENREGIEEALSG